MPGSGKADNVILCPGRVKPLVRTRLNGAGRVGSYLSRSISVHASQTALRRSFSGRVAAALIRPRCGHPYQAALRPWEAANATGISRSALSRSMEVVLGSRR